MTTSEAGSAGTGNAAPGSAGPGNAAPGNAAPGSTTPSSRDTGDSLAHTGSPQVSLGRTTLIAMVVGSMIGAGVFSLPQRFAEHTGVIGAAIAWGIAGAGMLTLALTFQTLAIRRPTLDAGVYAYAKAGFGEYLGFFSAFGYWASACVGNVTYWVLIMSTLGALVPALGDGDTLVAMAASSAGLWLFYLLVRRGVREAALINRIVTIAKLVPIVVFIALAAFALDPDVFMDNLTGDPAVPVFDQVRGTMLVTVFVFLGVEGASVYSRHARRRQDVGFATVLGFASVLAVFASVSIVSYGILPTEELAALRQPSMAGVLEAAVGSWGGGMVSVGLIVSVLGAYLAWTLMAAEVLFVAAKDRDMPRFLARTGPGDVPVAALLASTVLSQIMVAVVWLSSDAFDFALDLTSALSLIPFLLAAAFLVKIGGWQRGRLLGLLATGYVVFLIFAAGPSFLLLSFIIYAPATVWFIKTRREQRRPAFQGREWVVAAVTTGGAVTGIVALALGWITL